MNLSKFLKTNKKVKENTTYTLDFFEGEEKPVLIIRPLTTKENNALIEACTYEKQVTGKPDQYTTKMNRMKYVAMMAAAAVVEPDLYDAELQDSYGVSKPEDLIQEMFDDPGEWNKFIEFINRFNGFDKSINEDIEEAKN